MHNNNQHAKYVCKISKTLIYKSYVRYNIPLWIYIRPPFPCKSKRSGRLRAVKIRTSEGCVCRVSIYKGKGNINSIFLLPRCPLWFLKFDQSILICRGGGGYKFTREYLLIVTQDCTDTLYRYQPQLPTKWYGIQSWWSTTACEWLGITFTATEAKATWIETHAEGPTKFIAAPTT